MINPFTAFLKAVDPFLSWLSTSLRQTTSSYCELETADSPEVLVARDGSLLSVLRISGVQELIGAEEFDYVNNVIQQSLQTIMNQPGHVVQVFFTYTRDGIKSRIRDIFAAAHATSRRINLDLEDLYNERVNYLSGYCAHEEVYMVLWTRIKSLTSEQNKRVKKDKMKEVRQRKMPPFYQTQNLLAAVSDLRESHDAFVRSVVSDFNAAGVLTNVLEVHEAVKVMRAQVDPDFTSASWRPQLPGDELSVVKEPKILTGEISDITWAPLARQLIPRDAENLNLRTCRVGDRIYSSVFIDLFPRQVQTFARLLSRTIPAHLPWRISFLLASDGLSSTRLRGALASVLAFTSKQNRLVANSLGLLNYIKLNTDDAVVKLRVAAATWAPVGDERLLRARTAQLARAIQGWGSCDTSEVSGDAFAGVVSSMLGIAGTSVASQSIAPLSNVLHMLPFFRPASPWQRGAILFRSPDGKLWPYQPGSRQQATWIDLFYARPGSGKSVLSNAINLAVCLSGGIQRLPRISIIDIGPSSSGLISLLKDALPAGKKHLVASHRLRMRPEFAINPFDTQLGCRFPTPQERSFLVNFLTLLATAVGSEKPYDGVADMAGLVVDELYKSLADSGNPNNYASGVEAGVDVLLQEIGFVTDQHTTWWEVTDALFMAGFPHEAMQAQRHAMPVLADVTSICRLSAIQDLYRKITVTTGEPLIESFARMISGAVREYPIISQVTRFDLGEARVVALDLDEVARSGGDSANRQTGVMYMLARYVLARHYYLTNENVKDMPKPYQNYHQVRIAEIREDPKRIVFDEFHRTANVKAVRDQVIQDMREGRKWNVQVALLSQSLEDFDSVMVEFATSVFIMDAGPEQAVRKTAGVFGLSETERLALKNRVHGPREGGATFLAQFATKNGVNTQLLTSTLGPIELWALNTTAEDVNIRNQLYMRIGSRAARQALAIQFPSGSARKVIEERLSLIKEDGGIIDDDVQVSVISELVQEIADKFMREVDQK